jgi:hypothetical protein
MTSIRRSLFRSSFVVSDYNFWRFANDCTGSREGHHPEIEVNPNELRHAAVAYLSGPLAFITHRIRGAMSVADCPLAASTPNHCDASKRNYGAVASKGLIQEPKSRSAARG